MTERPLDEKGMDAALWAWSELAGAPITQALPIIVRAYLTAATPAPSSGEAEPATWVETLEQVADSSFVSGARAAMLREIAEHLRFRHPSPSGVNAEGDGYFLQGDVAIGVMASLAAAISLLERSPKTAAPSDKMFDQMLSDYRNSLEAARSALQAQAAASGAGECQQ